GDSGVAPSGAVTALLGPSLFAGAGLDSGALRLRLADRRVYVDSLRLAQPGLVTTGSGSLGWTRGASGQLALGFDADSLRALDSLTWFARSRMGAGGAFLAGGRFARRPGPAGTVRAVGLDSLAVQLPGDVWVLERPTELTVTDSAARVSRLALKSVYGSGKLT